MTHDQEAYKAWKAALTVREDVLGGTPCFPGTRLSVEHVARLRERMTSAEIIVDYPYLTERDIEFASVFVGDVAR